MPTQLENAIQQLQDDVNSYQQGTKLQPKDDTCEWYLLRAKVLGLQYLKRLQTLGLGDKERARQCEELYKQGARLFKHVDIPPADPAGEQVPALLQPRPAGDVQ